MPGTVNPLAYNLFVYFNHLRMLIRDLYLEPLPKLMSSRCFHALVRWRPSNPEVVVEASSQGDGEMRYALTDRQWRQIEQFLPPNGHRGKQWKDHRNVINGILWILRTGAPWRDLPKEFGPWKTIYERFRLWSRNGFWDVLLTALKARKNRERKIDWRLFCIDGTIIRAHKASAGGGKKWAGVGAE